MIQKSTVSFISKKSFLALFSVTPLKYLSDAFKKINF